ncbi:MAG: sulfotransferase family protein [Pseudomonadota bacterium]
MQHTNFGLLRASFSHMKPTLTVSDRHKFVYVKNRKSGCSTIQLALCRAELDDPNFFSDHIHQDSHRILKTGKHVKFHDLIRLSLVPKFFVFTFVRNPYSRFLSAYLSKISRPQKQKAEVLIALGKDATDLKQHVSFEEFVELVASQAPREMNPHWAPQTTYLLPHLIRYDFIGRFETFEADMKLVLEKLKYSNIELTHFRKTGASYKLDDYYNERTKEIVRQIYKDDFIAFNYGTEMLPSPGLGSHRA